MTNEEVVKYVIQGVDLGASKLVKDITASTDNLAQHAKAATANLGGIGSHIREIGASGKLGGFIQDLSLGRSKTASLSDAMAGLRGHVRGLGGELRSLGGWIQAGFGIGIGVGIFNGLMSGLDSLINAIPNAIHAGEDWVQKVKDIQRVTGLAAEQASEWAAVMEHVGVPLGNVGQILAMFGRNLAENEDLFVKLGIATRGSNRDFLDAYTILTNTRRAFAQHGEQLVNTGAAQELFSRTGHKMLEVLQLSDAQWQAYAMQAAKAGQIVGGPLTDAVERFHRAQAGLNGVVQGVQTAIFAGVAPALESFVDGFTNWIQSHLQQIVDFVSQVANFIVGVIGGLFGIDFSAKTAEQSIAGLGGAADQTGKAFDGLAKSTKAAANADDAMTTSLNSQIKAIDGQIAAIRRRSDALHAAEERARLDAALATAQAQLADLKGNAPYTEGLSNAEAALARQKHAQDIVDAQKAVSDARGSLSTFNADQAANKEIAALEGKKKRLQDELAAHKKAIQAQAAGAEWLTGVNVKQDSAIAAAAKDMYAGITAKTQEWRDKGVAFAGDLKNAFGGLADTILGTYTASSNPHVTGGFRSGGVVGALSSFGGAVGDLARILSTGVSIIEGTIEGLVDLITKVLDLLHRVDWSFALPSLPGQGNSSILYDPYPKKAAGGWVGMNGPEIVVVGDGGEPELVVPKSKLAKGGPRESSQIRHSTGGDLHVHFNSVWPPTPDQRRRIIEMVDEAFAIKADNSPVGIQAFRGATR